MATACLLPGSVAAGIARLQACDGARRVEIEHPTGFLTVDVDVAIKDGSILVRRAALLRTARKLMQGTAFVPSRTWGAT
jgi:4-oxalomesaconate tautomerase